MNIQRLGAIGFFALFIFASFHASASELKIVRGEHCGASDAKVCANSGASCSVVHDKNSNAIAVCRWAFATSANACKKTSGIWTAADSKYARNNAGAVEPGLDGACITDVKNIKGKKAPGRTDRGDAETRTDHRNSENVRDHRTSGNVRDHRKPRLAAPSNLSVDEVSSTTLTLAWTDNSDGEYGVELYRVEPFAARSDKGLKWDFIGLVEERIQSNVKGTGLRSDEDFELAPGTNYCYRLRAYVGFDRSEVSGFSDAVCTKTRP